MKNKPELASCCVDGMYIQEKGEFRFEGAVSSEKFFLRSKRKKVLAGSFMLGEEVISVAV